MSPRSSTEGDLAAPTDDPDVPVPATAEHEASSLPRREVCHIDGLLDCGAEPGVRFTYSAYFVPRRLVLPNQAPLLTRAQRLALRLKFLAREAEWLAATRTAHPELLRANRLALAEPSAGTATGHGGNPAGPRADILDGIARVAGVVGRYFARSRWMPLRLTPSDQAEIIARQEVLLGAGRTDTDAPLEQLLNLIRSEVGYLFLDRTRISPAGYAVGEHVYSLSLAPGEEVTLEQKTFSKRETTFEEQSEQEFQLDLELSSTLSTELQEGFQRQQSLTTASGLTTGGHIGLEVKGVEVGANLTSTNSVSEADSQTGNRSVKESANASRKVASKYRRAHKVTFKVSAEERFEATSKRVIRNPNRFTALNLEYFKRLHVIDLEQERYGVRLCWAPCIRDPGAGLAERLAEGRKAIVARAMSELEEEPKPPVKPDKPVLFRGLEGEVKYSDNVPGVGPMLNLGGPIYPPKDGYTWNGDVQYVRDNVKTQPTGFTLWVGEPVRQGDGVNIPITAPLKQGKGDGKFILSAGAQFVEKAGPEDAAYKTAVDSYYTRYADWEQKRDEARAQGLQEAAQWAAAALATPNLISELVSALVAQMFPVASRDECWELDLWQTLFDWDSASYTLYPAWWTSPVLREPTMDPVHFLNASWAKVYIPVRVGSERLALRWILGGVVEQQLDPSVEAVIKAVADDLASFRTQHFGGPTESHLSRDDTDCPDHDEAFMCLGRWRELVPADGTHVEIVQSATSGQDPISAREAGDAARRTAAETERIEHDAAIKKHILDNLDAQSDVRVRVVSKTS